MNIIGMRIGGENIDKGDQLTLSIEPNATSPSSRFLIRLQYRSKEKGNIESFYHDLDAKIIDFINQMEKT